MAIGEQYDARFLEDRLAIFPQYSGEARAEVPYAEIEDVEIGGPGLVKSGGGFIGGGFGAVGALEGVAIASVLNALTTRTSITTIVRVQGVRCELFLLHTRSTPEQLSGRDVSRARCDPGREGGRSARRPCKSPLHKTRVSGRRANETGRDAARWPAHTRGVRTAESKAPASVTQTPMPPPKAANAIPAKSSSASGRP